MRKNWIIAMLAGALITPTLVFAQEDAVTEIGLNPVITGVPSLTIAPDARGGGMGDIGAATTPDVNSQYWNPAKYAFTKSNAGVSLSYTPWLRKLVNDIDLAYLAGYYKFGNEGMQSVSASLRYFSLGKIDLTDTGGNIISDVSPYEMAFDIGYSRKLSDYFSGAVTLRAIYSDLQTTDEDNSGSAFAADIAGYYTKPITYNNGGEGDWSLGFNISNIGSKINFASTSNFIPTNLRLGAGIRYPFDSYNSISVYGDVNKLLVPTRPQLEGDETTESETYQARLADYENMSPIKGIFKSFSDAPGGMSEELKEVAWSLGAEYNYNDQFFARGGYYNENMYKGNRKYFSLGAGFKMNVFKLDVAYLISTAQSNPLDQTLRFSLSFDLDGLKSLVAR